MRTRRGFCYPSINPQAAAEEARRKRRRGASAGDRFEELPDELVISILGKLSASATSPSDLFNAFLTCKRFKELGHDPLVLSKASGESIWIRARNWSKPAHRFLARCADAGNLEACCFLGMIRFYCLASYESGAAMLARAAYRNHPASLYALGVIRFNGSGADCGGGSHCIRDPKSAAAFCIRSAALGNLDALREVGYCLRDGLGLPCNPDGAKHLILRANNIELSINANSKKISKARRNWLRRQRDSLLSLYGRHVPVGQEVHPANRFMVEWRQLARERLGECDQKGLQFCSNVLCGRRETRCNEFRRCSGCSLAIYCSRSCQAVHWKLDHRIMCGIPPLPLDPANMVHGAVVAPVGPQFAL